MPQIPGLLGDQMSPEEMAQMAQVPGLLAPRQPEPPPETAEQAAAAIRNHLQMLDYQRTMSPESGYAIRPEPIIGGPAYGVVGGPAGPALSPAEQKYWEDYSQGLQQTELQQYPHEDPGLLARIAREAQRVAPMPPATGPGGATYPLYQSPYDLYQSLQMSPRNFDTWATRRAQEAVSR